MFSRMPVPVWDSDMVFLEEPLDTTTVVSDDIWKKFDLDVPLDHYHHRYQNDLMDSGVASSLPPPCETPMMMHFDKLNCQASREIRHHDCMWAGLCISKEHNRTHPAKKDSQIHRRIPAGRSLLIPKNNLAQQQQQQQSHLHQQQLAQSRSLQASLYQGACRVTTTMGPTTTTKNLESDGDSTRPETPQSSEEEETESEEEDEEDEVPVFRHEQININDIVSMPISEVTNQQMQRHSGLYGRIAQEKAAAQKETNIRNTLMSDHCYHLNQQSICSKKLEHLGVQTPSDSEEEIDVVSFEKPTRPVSTGAATLPTHPSPAEQQHFQLTVKTAFKERQQHTGVPSAPANPSTTTTAATTIAAPAPRPRGRPPSNPTRKRAIQVAAAAAAEASTKPAAKRARHHRAYQRRASPQKQQQQQQLVKSSPTSSPVKSERHTSSRSSSDDEPDTEKRSLHNNMERQRRIELRNAFEDLRVLVPEVEAKEKAPKVAILRQAAAYCDRLTDLDQMSLAKVAELKKKQERLRAQLSHLRRSLAMQR